MCTTLEIRTTWHARAHKRWMNKLQDKLCNSIYNVGLTQYSDDKALLLAHTQHCHTILGELLIRERPVAQGVLRPVARE